MFNDKYGLTQAVIDGKKTMTRRIIPLCENDLNFLKVTDKGEWLFSSRTCLSGAFPAYKVGDEIAIAQSYQTIFDEADNGDYWADCYERFRQAEVDDKPGWRNKMFVSAYLMPHHIRIKDIKVERLQDISDEDCMREGVEKWMDCYIVTGIMERGGKNNMCFDTPRLAFAAIIDRISGKGTWERNPWVFAYEFELD